ncbi:MAG: peptide deformylase [Patescibacteria group bacterium]
MIQKILRSGDPNLRKKSKVVIKVDKKILNLIADLKDTLAVQKDPQGVGLAAPQIGKNLRVFVADFEKFKKVVINPEIVAISEKQIANSKTKNEIMEGCLSLPNYYGPLKRNQKVRIKYLNEKGEKIMEEFKDFNAQIILHEIDHLEGILFMDRLFEQKQSLYKLDGDEWEEVEL